MSSGLKRANVGLLALAALVASVVSLGRAQAGGTVALFILNPQQQTVQLSDGSADVQVRIQNVSGMAAFQFVLRYDAGVLKDPTVDAGSLLPGADCPPTLVDTNGSGTVQFGCATTGLGSGVSGSGLLATVHFILAGGAFTNVLVEKAEAANSESGSVCANGADFCDVENGFITVAGGDPGKQQGLSATPTPGAATPGPTPPSTPLPTATAGVGGSSSGGSTTEGATPGQGGTSAAPATGETAPGSAGAAATGGSATIHGAGGAPGSAAGVGSGNQSAGGVGRFGTGPGPQPVRHYEAWAGALAVLGVALLAVGEALRRRGRRLVNGQLGGETGRGIPDG